MNFLEEFLLTFKLFPSGSSSNIVGFREIIVEAAPGKSSSLVLPSRVWLLAFHVCRKFSTTSMTSAWNSPGTSRGDAADVPMLLLGS